MATASKSQLNDDIYLYTTRQQPSQSPDGLMTISYEVESTFFGDVHFTISIDGSTNFAFDQDLSKGVKVTVPVPPCQRVLVAHVVMVDRYSRAQLKVDFSWEYKQFDLSRTQELATFQNQRVEGSIAVYEHSVHSQVAVACGYDDRVCAFNAVIAHCRQHQCQFVDLDFAPCKHSIAADAQANSNSSNPILQTVVWRRPLEFIPASTSIAVFRDGTVPNDIKQGTRSPS
jgi:hypothetical protein